MLARRIALLLLLYVSLDFSNPLMPGAVAFELDGSVNAIRAGGRLRADIAPPPGPSPRVAPLVLPATDSRPAHATAVPASRFAMRPPLRRPARDPVASSDDH